jgi:hypothetical protein
MANQMRSSKHEQQMIVDYMASQRVDETIVHLEKIHVHRVGTTKYAIWNVQTDAERYWVITPPTNFYVQAMFPETDIALSFHIGLMHRVMARGGRLPRASETTRFAVVLRRMDQAIEALEEAEEAEDFQAVGIRCRECLIAFIKETSDIPELPAGTTPPKEADFKSWIELLINTIASGKSNERRRAYMKGVANETWELTNWLTHGANSTAYDASLVIDATDWLLWTIFMAIGRFEEDHPQRCLKCRSYNVISNSIVEDGNKVVAFQSCSVCGWESEHQEVTDVATTKPRRRRKPSSRHIIIEVPIRSEQPPPPSYRNISSPSRADLSKEDGQA